MSDSILAAALTAPGPLQRSFALETNAKQTYQDEQPENVMFSVDRTRIRAVGESEQADELRSLGLSVYDQTTLEQGILEQVDKAFEQQEKHKLDAAIKSVAEDIASCKEQLTLSETQLFRVTLKESLAVRNSITARQKQLNVLKIKEQSLLAKRREFVEVKSCTDKSNQEQDNDDMGTRSIALAILRDDKNGETEIERKIRLGEMTPFGTVVAPKLSSSSKNKCPNMTELEKYLHNQQVLQRKHKEIKKSKKSVPCEVSLKKIELQEKNVALEVLKPAKKRSPFKKSILTPKKHKRKEKRLGTSTSHDPGDQHREPGHLLSEKTELETSGSEYLPSSDEEDEEERRHVKRSTQAKSKGTKRKTVDSWGTDDSDWESSDEEGVTRRRKNRKKCVDDGNFLEYKERVKTRQEGESMEMEESYHELDMDFKLPLLLWNKLYKYQQVGVQWLWELHQKRCGGILGDEMGLGKTIQIIAFLAGLSVSEIQDSRSSYHGLGPVLIVCPTTLMHQWVKEFHDWWPPCRVCILHESGSHIGKKEALIRSLSSRGVLVTSYHGMVQHKDALLDRDWQYVILDEGHKIRNPDAQVTVTVKMFRTPHRLILSGSPMQNNLKELWSLFDFIFPGKLGTLPVFLSKVAVPITQGGYANATQVQVATAYRCATMLRDTIAPFLLQRLKPDVQSHIQLPPKNEQVLFCRLTEEQKSMYRTYLDSGDLQRIFDGRLKVFVGLIQLRKICNHPDIYSGGPKLMKWDDEDKLPEEQRFGYWRKAGKMLVIESLLKIWQKQKHRVLLFTQSRQMLCILENFVQKQGYTYLKLDGGTSISARQPLVNKFNEDPSIFVFILTTHVGGLGINLTGADRVVIYDPDWNPATDVQARERAWRIGQQNQVTVYRLITAGTIEEKIYHRQIFKQFLTNKVLRDPRQRRFFKTNDLFELFTLKDEDDGKPTETASIFAGTNSEVKVNLMSKPKPKKPSKILPKIEIKKPGPSASSVAFSQEKMECMKKLAQMLSRKIGTKETDKDVSSEKVEQNINIEVTVCDIKTDCVDKQESVLIKKEGDMVEEGEIIDGGECKPDVGVEDVEGEAVTTPKKQPSDMMAAGCISSPGETASGSSTAGSSKKFKMHKENHDHYHNHKHKHRKMEKKHRGTKFEGERIPYLVKQSQAKEEKVEEKVSKDEDDDYVLKKLFKTSGGIHEVLKHDAIIAEGDPDYALVEGEARRVAQDAVKALKESRSQCWDAASGVPSWTGQSGALRAAKPRFGKKKTFSKTSLTTIQSEPSASMSSTNERGSISSQELLSRIKNRNALFVNSSENRVDISKDNAELLAELRNFIAYGGSILNSATTEEILQEFRNKLPSGMSPLFKFLLMEICEFYRLPNNQGMWKLRPEFR